MTESRRGTPVGPGFTPALPSNEAHGSQTLPPRLARRSLIAGTLITASLAGCGSHASTSSTPSTPAPTTSPSLAPPSAAPSLPPATSAAASPSSPPSLEGWSLEQKVGQLLMVGVDAAGSGTSVSRLVTDLHVGGIFLSGRTSRSSAAVRGLVDSLTALVGPESTRDTPLLVSTDQEGGEVQVLSGSGFSEIPSALDQASSSVEALTASATTWGQELAAAGVTMNLAPVADLVDITPSANAPIGYWHREYGHDAATVTACAGAFASGMEAGGVIPTLKHFPGLGRITSNTDNASAVTDSATSRTDNVAVGVFASLIGTGNRAVMMSSAVYSLIDPEQPAVFSSVVVTDMLRGDLGFKGVVITDDVAAATQVSAWDPGQRAVLAVRAGCDIVLASADASVADEMVNALLEEARSDAAFAQRVDESVQRVLALKSARAV